MPRDVRLPKANLTADSLLTSHEVAHHIQMNSSSVNKWVTEGRIAAFRTPGGHRRMKASDVVAFLMEHEMPVPSALSNAATPEMKGGAAISRGAPAKSAKKR